MSFSPANYFITPDHERDYKAALQARLVVNTSLLTSLFSGTYLILSHFMGFEMGVYLMVFNVLAFLILPFLIKSHMPTLWVGNAYVFAGAFAVVVLIYYSGGFSSPVMPWLIYVPAISLLLLNRISAYFWTFISVSAVGYFSYWEFVDQKLPVTFDASWDSLFGLMCMSGIVIIVFVINLTFEKNRNSAVDGLAEKNQELESTLKQLKITQKAMANVNKGIRETNQRLTDQKIQIASQRENLRKLNEQKDYIIEILSHDLKSPLHSMQGLIGVMETEELTGDQKESLKLMRASTEKANDLINKVLDIGMLQEQKVNLDLVPVDLVMLLSEVVEDMTPLAEAKEIAIQVQYSNPVLIDTDRLYARQIFENLLSNAIKFSPHKSTVQLKLTVANQVIRISIQDEGPGIKEEEKGLLFSKYSRLSARPTGGESSTGLGLSLVKRYVELLGGEVSFTSEVGKGSTFIVEFQQTK